MLVRLAVLRVCICNLGSPVFGVMQNKDPGTGTFYNTIHLRTYSKSAKHTSTVTCLTIVPWIHSTAGYTLCDVNTSRFNALYIVQIAASFSSPDNICIYIYIIIHYVLLIGVR